MNGKIHTAPIAKAANVTKERSLTIIRLREYAISNIENIRIKKNPINALK